MTESAAACSRCEAASIHFARYSGDHLCARHFLLSVDDRVSKQVRVQGGLTSDVRVVVGVSGGKDSTVALHQTVRLLEGRRDAEVVAVTVDEGIAGYRSTGLASAQATCLALGVEHRVVRTEDLAGVTIDQVGAARPERAPCSFCGVFRRRLLNQAARQVDADIVVTGHNLDDTAQSVLMNLVQGDVDRLGRLGPHEVAKPGLVPRRTPLRTIPELEVYLYAMVRGYAFDDATCPYAGLGQRNLYRDTLARLEDARPGTRHSLLATLERIQPWVAGSPDVEPVGRCGRCGEAASGPVCQTCRLSEEALELVRMAQIGR